jgi:hypothetical protein
MSGLFVLLTAALLSACVPTAIDRTGIAGVGVDDRGELIGYIAMCSGHVDGAKLYETDGPTLGEWKAPAIVEGFATWSLNQPGDWTALRTYLAPTGDGEYSLYGWSNNNTTGASHVTFHLRDLSDLGPGQVLYGSGSLETVDEDSFRSQACLDAGTPLP